MALTPYPSLAALPEVTPTGRVPNSYLNPSWISLKYDLGIPDDVPSAALASFGSSSFTDAAYGTLNLPALGTFAAQTVTQRIQAALDRAANGPVGLLWDVRCSIGAQATPGLGGDQLLAALTLRRPGNLHVLARPGCGAVLRPQTNAAMFANESPTFGTIVSGAGTDQAVAAIGGIAFGNVTFENLTLNANSGLVAAGYVSSANQPSPTFGQTFYLNVMRLWGVRDLAFKGCTLVGAGGFHLYFGNWQRILAAGCTVDSLGSGYNGTLLGGNDAFHLNGPGDQFTARDCSIATEDDYIAINVADGNNNSGRNHGPSVPAWGAITRVRGYNLRSTRADNLGGNFVRVMACAGIAQGGHEFEGLSGKISGLALLHTSGSAGANPGSIGSVRFRDIDVDFAQGFSVGQGTPLVNVARLGISGVSRSGSNLAAPLVLTTSPITQLDLADLSVVDDGTSGSSKPQVEVQSTGSVVDFSASRIRLYGSSGQQAMPVLKIDSGGSVGTAALSDVKSDKVLNLVANAGTLTNLIQSGLRMTNAGSGAIVANSGSWTKSVLSNTDPGALDCTGTAPTTKAGDFYGTSGGFAAPSLALSPARVGPSLTGQSVTVTGTDFTTATTFSLSGPSGTSITNTVVHSRTSATLTVTTGSTTGTATITCSDFSTAILSVANAPATYLDDTFTGTAGTSLTGHTASPTNHGSDAWGDLISGFGFGAMGYAAGGGATALALTGGAALSSYPLTGIPQDSIATFKVSSSSNANALMQIHRDGTGDNTIAITLQFSGNNLNVSQTAGGVVTSLQNITVPMPLNSTHTLVATTVGTSLTITFNGAAVGTGFTIPAGTGTTILIGQNLGSVGDVVYHEVAVTSI